MKADWRILVVAGAVSCGGGAQEAGAPSSPPAASSVAPAASSSPSASVASAPAASAPALAASAASPPATGGSVLVGDIPGTLHFDPKAAVEAIKADLLDCFNRARGANPALHGKLTLSIVVNEAGHVNRVDAKPGGLADDAGLVACVSDVLKTGAQFPKPGGTATVTVPLVFRR